MLAALFSYPHLHRIIIAKKLIVFYIVRGFWIRAWNFYS